MAYYMLPSERRVQLTGAQKLMNRIVILHNNVERVEKEMRDAGYNTTNIDTAIQGLLTEIEDVADQIVTFFSSAPNSFIQWTNAMRAKPHGTYADEGYYYATIDVDNGSSRATITSKDVNGNAGGIPFTSFAANDVVEIAKCADPLNNGTYTVYSKTDTVLTLTTTMGGGDVAQDFNVEVILRDRP